MGLLWLNGCSGLGPGQTTSLTTLKVYPLGVCAARVNSAIRLSLSPEGAAFLAWLKGAAGSRFTPGTRLVPAIWLRVPRFLMGKAAT